MKPTTKILLDLFKIEGKKGSEALTKGQVEIFESLVYRQRNRIQIESCTQYGKSLIVALACIIISCVQKIVVPVVAPNTDKAKQIMRYYIEHLGDSLLFETQLEANTKLERLKQEESKSRIILRNGGGIYTLSTNERNFQKSIESAMGAGGQVTIIDEAGLIRDTTEATIYRMIAGKKNACYVKIGNPFYRDKPISHFWNSHNDKKYLQLNIDYKQALKEGRYNEEFINEARKKPMFDVLYECVFPPKLEIDAKGYRFLLSDETINNCQITKLKESKESKKLGSDIGEGNNANAHVARQGNQMWIAQQNRSKELMAQVGIIGELLGKDDENFVDKIGVGAGVANRCKERGLNTTGIHWGKPAEDSKQFSNLKAENYWNFKLWLEAGGKILWEDDWEQLRQIKYKINSSGKVQMESKQDMAERGLESPDIADAGALTFNKKRKPKVELL